MVLLISLDMQYYVYDLLGMQSFLCADAINSTPGRMFVLFGDVFQCMGHHLLQWYSEEKIKHWQKECQKCFDVKDRNGVKHAQEMMISWRHCLRVLQGIVHGFFDEPGESVADRRQHYQNSSLSECSSPSFWQEVHHGTTDDLSDEDFVANYVTARESILRRARAGYEDAYVHGDHERMYHFENIINTITPL